MTLTDAYTPEGQAPAPYSLEGMWEDHVKRLRENGLADEEIEARKYTFYRAAYCLTDELFHFVAGGSDHPVLRDYHKQAVDFLQFDLDSPKDYIPAPPKSLAAN